MAAAFLSPLPRPASSSASCSSAAHCALSRSFKSSTKVRRVRALSFALTAARVPELLKKWHVDEELLESAQQTPNCLLATSFLLRLAYDRPFFESLAAFLPVLWINMAVARHLLHVRKPSIREDYARFLEVYGSLSLGESLADMVGLLDEVAIEVSEEDRLVMRRHFALSSKIVYMQYDMGHTEQRWPI